MQNQVKEYLRILILDAIYKEMCKHWRSYATTINLDPIAYNITVKPWTDN